MKQENTQKTFVIKTMTEKRYAQISASVRPIDLNIVDNDDKNRTVVASYDIVNEKFGKAINAVDSLTIEYDSAAHALVLENGAGCYASVDVSSFIKDQVLKGVSAELNDERLEFTFETYSDDPRTESKFITASCLMPVDDSLDSVSKNPIENCVVANKFTSVDTDISDLRRVDKELSDAIFDSHIVRYVDGTGERRHIMLKNNDNILGYGTGGTGPYNLAMVSQWNKADFGSDKIELNLNAVGGIVTVNDHDIVVTENRDNTLSGTNTFTGGLCVDFGKLIDITSESSIVEISNDLAMQINTASSDLSAAISDEISDRIDADIALSSDLTGVIGAISSELSGALTLEISNRTAADEQLSADIVGQLSARFFDITKYGFENKAESQCVAGTDLITDVVDSIHAGNMTVIRVGGYDVLVNAVVDKAVGYNDVSGFCGYVLSAETTNGNSDKFIANATQIRVMFYSARMSSFMDLNVEDSDYKAIIKHVSSDLSADYQKQINNVNDNLKEISAELSSDYSEKINSLQADVIRVSADLSTDYSGKINDLHSQLTTEISEISSGLDQRISSIEGDYLKISHYNALSNEISTETKRATDAENAITSQVKSISAGLSSAISSIEEDYLKRSDYDALSDAISAETKRAGGIEHAICSYVDSHISSEITAIGNVSSTDTYAVFERIGIGENGKLSAKYKTLTVNNISGLDARLAVDENKIETINGNVNTLDRRIGSCETSCASISQKYESCVPKTWVTSHEHTGEEGHKIVTEDDLKKFDNTFKFAGIVSSDPSKWDDATHGEGREFYQGDIVIGRNDVSSIAGKEWLLYLSSGTTFKWEEIGDQNMYVMKADLDAEKRERKFADDWLSGTYLQDEYIAGENKLGGIKTGYTADAGDKNYAVRVNSDGNAFVNVPWENTTYSAGDGISIDDNNNEISISSEYLTKWNSLSAYDEISAQLKNDGYALSSDVSSKAELESKFSEYADADKHLSGAISNKIKVGEYNAELINQDELSVVKIAAEDYYRLVAEEKTNPDVVYVVSSDNINGHDQRVINVGTAISATDAVNLSYVQNAIDSKTSCITTIWQGISGLIELANKNDANVEHVFEAVSKIYNTLSAFFNS